MSDRVITIGGDMISHVLATADKVLSKAVELMGSEYKPEYLARHSGGYLVWTFDDGTPIIGGALWGTVYQSIAERTRESALEQALRLSEHHRHMASYRTRDPQFRVALPGGGWESRPKRGGAIRAHDYLLSFAGLPEKYSEAAMFVTAIRLDWIQSAVVLRRINPKRNKYLRPLLAVAHWTE